MDITITLDEESTAAVNKRVDEHNAAVDERNAQLTEGDTPEEHIDAVAYMTARCEKIVEGWVRADYINAVKRLGDGAAKLDYATRTALIANIESQIPDNE